MPCFDTRARLACDCADSVCSTRVVALACVRRSRRRRARARAPTRRARTHGRRRHEHDRRARPTPGVAFLGGDRRRRDRALPRDAAPVPLDGDHAGASVRTGARAAPGRRARVRLPRSSDDRDRGLVSRRTRAVRLRAARHVQAAVAQGGAEACAGCDVVPQRRERRLRSRRRFRARARRRRRVRSRGRARPRPRQWLSRATDKGQSPYGDCPLFACRARRSQRGTARAVRRTDRRRERNRASRRSDS